MNVSRTLLLSGLIALFCGCSNAPAVTDDPARFTGGGRHAVYITNHGWHTGVIVPAAPMQARVPHLAERFPAARQMEFGWGDKDFYQAAESSLGLALQAILWPTDTVVRAIGISRDMEDYAQPAGLVGLCVDDRSLAALLTFLEQSFARGPDGGLQPSQTSPGRRSQFYEGTGQYHLFNTCNTWTAKALNSMGMDISPTLKLTAGSVMDYLKQHPDATTLSVYEESAQTEVRPFSCSP